MKSLSLILAALAALTFVSCSSTPSAAKAGTAPKAKNLALGKTATSNNHILDFSSDKSVDGDTASYFEGAANAYPNLLTIDLEKKVSLKSVTIRLNRSAEARICCTSARCPSSSAVRCSIELRSEMVVIGCRRSCATIDAHSSRARSSSA